MTRDSPRPQLLVPLTLCCLCCAHGAVTAQERPAASSAARAADIARYAPYPPPDVGYVTDLANLLSRKDEERIESWLWQVEEKTDVEVAVVTIQSIKDYPETDNATIESFATALFNKYGIGNLPRNDGVLLLVAKDDRKARIELGASHGRTRDADAARIMERAIIPRFKEEQYAEGITDGVKAIVHEFAGIRIGTNWTLILLITSVPFLAVISYSLFKSGKRGWGWITVGILIIVLLAVVRILLLLMGSKRGGSSAGGSGGGFGGGFSGGGGATGSW